MCSQGRECAVQPRWKRQKERKVKEGKALVPRLANHAHYAFVCSLWQIRLGKMKRELLASSL
jgi:hypothetical protein